MHQGWWKSRILSLLLLPSAVLASDFPVPRLPQGSRLLENTAYIASYNSSYKQSDWIFYALGKNELRSCVERSNNFRVDARVPAGEAAQLSDYRNSGFDRGHLIPAGDSRWSEVAMKDSFLLTNVSPQRSGFNSGIWAKFEGIVRAWAINLKILVTTGPLLSNSLPTIGTGKIAVPEYFYKVLTTTNQKETKAIAFLLPTDASGDLAKYAMTVDQLEEITGLDFLMGLQGEEQAESHFDLENWDLNAKFQYLPCNAIAPNRMEWAWGLSAR